MALRRGSASNPSVRSICLSASARQPTSARKCSPLRWWGSGGAYHAILGGPCYAKFMAIPNYTYLKMKMSGPKGVITVGSSFEHAYECDIECVKHPKAQAEDEALAATLDKL